MYFRFFLFIAQAGLLPRSVGVVRSKKISSSAFGIFFQRKNPAAAGSEIYVHIIIVSVA
jgi:hypothetical protein